MTKRSNPASDLLRDLSLLIRSRYGLIFLRTAEEDRAETLLRYLADSMSLALFVWRRSKGLKRSGLESEIYDTKDLLKALTHAEKSAQPAIYQFRVHEADFEHPTMVEHLRDAIEPYQTRPGAVVLTGPDIEVPPALQAQSALLQLPPPAPQDYQELIRHILRDLSQRMKVDYTLSREELKRVLNGLQGLTLMEAEKVLTKSIVEDGKLSIEDLEHIVDAKREIVEEDGVLEYFPVEESLAEMAGLDALKSWLRQRQQLLLNPTAAEQYNLPFPKGILLVGVPGCGKSLSAKAVATEWSLPLLRLDPSRLYNKYIGETEKNFRRAVATAERIAPVILWIDELEKALASGGADDGGVSKRVFGNFLSWMQDREAPVFVVATANDVHRLPPELLRKGRFDEIFFVDLPGPESRREILKIHLAKRGQDAQVFDLDRLVDETHDFSGAELEQAVVAALFAAFAAERDLDDETLLYEIRATRPLARTMAERVEELRLWAEGRVRSAHSDGD